VHCQTAISTAHLVRIQPAQMQLTLRLLRSPSPWRLRVRAGAPPSRLPRRRMGDVPPAPAVPTSRARPPSFPACLRGAVTAGGAAPNLQYMGTADIAASWMRCGWSVPQHDRGAGQHGRDRAGLDGHSACITAGCTSNLPHTCTQVGAAHLRQVHRGGGSLEMRGSLGQQTADSAYGTNN
jgi:hypothetical protein